MWYEFDQNNSGGSFIVNNEVCHRLFIEADNDREAISKAEDLGCYWDGVAFGRDCPCCGDRWSKDFLETVDLEEFKDKGYRVGVYDGIYSDTIEEWNRKYGSYTLVAAPKFEQKFNREYVGSICFDTIEQYAQFLADEYGWTDPDARVFYKDGRVVDVHSSRRKVA